MILKNPIFIALATVLAVPVASTSEAAWSQSSVGDLSIFVTLQRFRIYAVHCSAEVPQLKPKFDGLMEDLNSRIQGISKALLSSDVFNGVKDKPVPAEISFALKDSLDDAKHNFERQDADAICPKTLQNLGEMGDESLKADLMQTLVAVQNMTRNLEKEGAH
jgi:hypothetical protein